TALLPVVETLQTKLSGLIDFVTANSSWLVPLAMSVGTLAVAFVGIAKAVEIFKGVIEGLRLVWMLLNTAFLSSPLGWIVLALAAVVVAFVLLYTKVAWFRDFVNAAWAAIRAAFAVSINWIVSAFNGFIAFIKRWGDLLLVIFLGPFYVIFR